MSRFQHSANSSGLLKKMLVIGSIVLINTWVPSSMVNAADLHASDKEFLLKAADAGITEVVASKNAQTKGLSAEVKSFAAAMVKDHTAVNEELKTLATAKGVTIPEAPSSAQQAKIEALNTLEGEKFDHKYAAEIGVTAHRDAVALFKRAEKKVHDKDIKAFAAKTLPSLQHHLKMAEDLKKKVDSKHPAP